MSSTSNNSQLFGLDLAALWQDMRRPWQEMHRWPLLSWLTPAVPVRLLQADGGETTWLDGKASAKRGDTKAVSARFVALELLEDIVLRRRLVVPAMSDAQTADAVALEVRTISPFAPDDLVWGYSRRQGSQGQADVEAVLASHKQIDQYLQTQSPRLQGAPTPEVWVLAQGFAPIVMAGFGEGRRLQHMVFWRRVGYGLLLLALCILAAIAITPTAQLRLRAVEAVNAYTTLHLRTQPLAQQREALVKSTDRLVVLGEMMAVRIDPLKVMDLLTQALPDDSALLSLQIQGLKVTMGGQTTNAAALMQHLSTQPGIRDVRAPTAATRPLGVAKDSFTIEFTLDPKALAPPLTDAVAGASGAAGSAVVPAASPVALGGAAMKTALSADTAPASVPVAPAATAPSVAAYGPSKPLGAAGGGGPAAEATATKAGALTVKPTP